MRTPIPSSREIMRLAVCASVLLVLGCSVTIHHGLDESSANEALVALERAGIGASKAQGDDGAFAISVNRADVISALDFMRAAGLPRGKRSGFAETYKQPSLVPSATEERARYMEALAGEIARTLESVEGVVSARVHLVLPETDLLGASDAKRTPAQAAVLVKARAGHALPISEAEVQKLVAGSAAGLDRGAVAVVFTQAAGPVGVPNAELVSLGPLRLTAGSRGTVIAAASGLGLLVGLLAVVLFLTARRLAAVERTK
jgi:type III secretion protein J